MSRFEPYRRAFRDSGPILFRHVFILVNAIIFAVVALLIFFGNAESGIFLALIIIINIILGAGQDIRARISLENLQMMTALRVVRLEKDGTENEILSENVSRGDRIKLRLGDQVPCDGTLISSEGLEVSEALLSGESDSFPKNTNDTIQGGSIVTAGTAIFLAGEDFRTSRMAVMTEEAKKYAAKPSPIQQAIARVIKITGFVLLVSIAFVIVRGLVVHDPYVLIVLNIGALASTLVPQGLVVITTLFFAFGASSYMDKKVLFQEINATEKLGRIKNLCMDKTGTLTENTLCVEVLHPAPGYTRDDVCALTVDYDRGAKDPSQTMKTVADYARDHASAAATTVTDALPFSSWRQYGAVKTSDGTVIMVGSPDAFIQHLGADEERQWLTRQVEVNSRAGKRILCVVRGNGEALPRSLDGVDLSVAGIFVLTSGLRKGVRDTVAFFQKRGVRIRIISGDNAETVCSIAREAGVNDSDKAITGKELSAWDDNELANRIDDYSIFARIVPEQKVRIIEALKRTGFTAMIGDGANDALAIKKADLGIAMFEGAPATRRLASVVLMDNRFTALPGGVELADNFIRNIEVFTGVFMNQTLVGMFFFVVVSLLGHSYPLTPLNISFINYFAVGMPSLLIGYWAIHPVGTVLPTSSGSFLKRVMPFVFWCSIIEAAAIVVVYAMSPAYYSVSGSNVLVGLAFIMLGFVFFVLAPCVYRGTFAFVEKLQLVAFGVLEAILLVAFVNIPLIVRFFEITIPLPSMNAIGIVGAIALGVGVIQYIASRQFFVWCTSSAFHETSNSL